MAWKGKRRLAFLGLALGTELLPRACDSEALFVEKLLDAQHRIHIFPPIHPLPRAALDRFELWEFRFPETKNICLKAAETGNFSNPEIELVRHHNLG